MAKINLNGLLTKAGLPKITQEPIRYIDATPDEEYPLRILRAYRQNCNIRWSNAGALEDDPALIEMNKACEKRAKLLDKAISILENHK